MRPLRPETWCAAIRRLPRRTERGQGFRRRDLLRAEALHRLVALGGRAVLPALRQMPGANRNRILVELRPPPRPLFKDFSPAFSHSNYLEAHSDALVIFGVTGDLAYQTIFPALYAMVKSGELNIPVIGVASSKWDLEQLRARWRGSIHQCRGIDDKDALDRMPSYSTMSAAITRTRPRLPQSSRRWARRATGALPCDSASDVRDGD